MSKTAALLAIILLAINCKGRAQSLPSGLRTDGCYIYDNGIREVRVLGEEGMRIIKQLEAQFPGPPAAPAEPVCLPKGAVAVAGKSSDIDVIAFSPAGFGTSEGARCRDTAAWNRIRSHLQKRTASGRTAVEASFDPTSLHNFLRLRNDLYSFEAGQPAEGRIDHRRQMQVYADSIVVELQVPENLKRSYRFMLQQLVLRKCYRFHPYDALPPAFTGGVTVREDEMSGSPLDK